MPLPTTSPSGSRYAVREQAIRNLFPVGATFNHAGQHLTVTACGKPHVGGGETKTDVFIAAADTTGATHELKISFKLHSAEFIENKLTAQRAAEVLGPDYQALLADAATALNISNRTFHNPGKETYVLGYRLDIMVQARNRTRASRSYHPIDLTVPALLRIYAGVDSTNNKQDAYVAGYNNGNLVPQAGVAEFILFDGTFTTAQQVIDTMEPIVDYVAAHPTVYLAFKAVNYRMSKHRDNLIAWDGNRPLAFVIDWSRDGNTFTGRLNQTMILAHHANSRGTAFGTLLA